MYELGGCDAKSNNPVTVRQQLHIFPFPWGSENHRDRKQNDGQRLEEKLTSYHLMDINYNFINEKYLWKWSRYILHNVINVSVPLNNTFKIVKDWQFYVVSILSTKKWRKKVRILESYWLSLNPELHMTFSLSKRGK